MRYILSIDQSTQGTKAILADDAGRIAARFDVAHRQWVDDNGWVEHDAEEIWRNVCLAVKGVIEKAEIDAGQIAGIGLSNQRETCMAWNRTTGKPVYRAIVWQCGRAAEICRELSVRGLADSVKEKTGMTLSPYFSAAKLAWILRHVPQAATLQREGNLCCGTIDSWLVWNMTGGSVFATDYSNASRTQLFNIFSLQWDEEICSWFRIEPESLPEVRFSDAGFGQTDLCGLLPKPVPIHCVLGDSHAALFAQGCHQPGMVKATYGTGSSIMMNIGGQPRRSKSVVTSLAWGIEEEVSYVLEGNINYTGAVMTWLKDDVGLIASAKEAGTLAAQANPNDKTYLVPAFSGLGAPYWDSEASAVFYGMTRTTGRKELVRAAEESIAYQITDVVRAMEQDAGVAISELRADGGPTADAYLMQFQADMLDRPIAVSSAQELSALGAAYCAGIALGIYDKTQIFDVVRRSHYLPQMEPGVRKEKYCGWQRAVLSALSRK